MRKKDKLYTIKQPINLYNNGSFLDIISNGNGKGECFITLADNSNVKVSTDFDLEKFRKLFKETFN